MNPSLRRLLAAALLALLAATALPAAEAYKIGDVFAPFTTKDQHDKTYTLEPGVRMVIVSFDMGSGKDVNGYLERKPADFLASQQAVFIANIYGMPGVGRMFAMPKMRKYPHRILLADEEHFLDRYPVKKGRLTVLRLDGQGRVEGVEFPDPEKELNALFAAKP